MPEYVFEISFTIYLLFITVDSATQHLFWQMVVSMSFLSPENLFEWIFNGWQHWLDNGIWLVELEEKIQVAAAPLQPSSMMATPNETGLPNWLLNLLKISLVQVLSFRFFNFATRNKFAKKKLVEFVNLAPMYSDHVDRNFITRGHT
jgi:hypothetical protein